MSASAQCSWQAPVLLVTHLVMRDTRAYYEHETSSVETSHPPHSSPQYSKPLPSSSLSGTYLSNGVEDCHSRNTWRKGSTIAASQPKQGCREMDSVFEREKGKWRAGAQLIEHKNRQTSGGLVLLQERICPRLPSAHYRLLYLS